jgi:hypothetical protein
MKWIKFQDNGLATVWKVEKTLLRRPQWLNLLMHNHGKVASRDNSRVRLQAAETVVNI